MVLLMLVGSVLSAPKKPHFLGVCTWSWREECAMCGVMHERVNDKLFKLRWVRQNINLVSTGHGINQTHRFSWETKTRPPFALSQILFICSFTGICFLLMFHLGLYSQLTASQGGIFHFEFLIFHFPSNYVLWFCFPEQQLT